MLHGLLIIINRRLVLLQRLVDETQIEISVGIGGIVLDGLLVRFNGIRILLQGQVDIPQIVPCAGQGGVQFDSPPASGDRPSTFW